MKKHLSPIILMTAIIIALIALTGCNVSLNTITGSGNVVEQEYDFIDFEEVEISHAFTATINQGVPFSVVVRVDDNLVEHLEVTQEGSRVKIGMEQGTMVTRGTMEVEITMPTITTLNGSGASEVQLNSFSDGDNLAAEFSGASTLHGDLAMIDLELEASGASNIFLAGTAGNVRAVASGASTIDLDELSAVDAQVEASGASTVTVNLDGILDANASGASNVYYLGNPEMGNIDTSGGSNVSPR